MMRLGSFVILSGALTACVLARPEGSYVPGDAGMSETTLQEPPRSDAAIAVAPPIPGGGGLVIGGTQAGGMSGGTTDAGVVGSAGGAGGVAGGPGGTQDAGVALSPAEQALKKLEGRYLMRMDMLSTASATASIVTISTKNRVSHLIATEFAVKDGQLKGYERLCHQTFAHVCTKGCTSLSTTMSQRMTDFFVMMPYTERGYTVSNGMLDGFSNTMPLGFDGTANPKIPTQGTDTRVWDPVQGGVREGLLLAIDLAAIKNVRCNVYNVQTFVSSFKGKLGGTGDAPSLAGPKFDLVTSSSNGNTLGASSSDCTGGQGAAPTSTSEYVRFSPVMPNEFAGDNGLEFWNCPPQSAWDTRLSPPSP